MKREIPLLAEARMCFIVLGASYSFFLALFS